MELIDAVLKLIRYRFVELLEMLEVLVRPTLMIWRGVVRSWPFLVLSSVGLRLIDCHVETAGLAVMCVVGGYSNRKDRFYGPCRLVQRFGQVLFGLLAVGLLRSMRSVMPLGLEPVALDGSTLLLMCVGDGCRK